MRELVSASSNGALKLKISKQTSPNGDEMAQSVRLLLVAPSQKSNSFEQSERLVLLIQDKLVSVCMNGPSR
jgi:hypothetical protein